MKILLKKVGDILIPANEKEKAKIEKFADAEYVCDIKNMDGRTLAQNNALHLYFSHIATVLNDSGYSIKKALNHETEYIIEKVFMWGETKIDSPVLQKMKDRILNNGGVDIDWSMTTVKELIWRPIQKARLDKDSTTNLTRSDIDVVYDTVNRFLASRFGIAVPFPNRELWEEKNKK